MTDINDPCAQLRLDLLDAARAAIDPILMHYSDKIISAFERGDVEEVSRLRHQCELDTLRATKGIRDAMAILPPPPVLITEEMAKAIGRDRA